MNVRDFVLGKPKNLHDPTLFHEISLIALFAWVGLGADGLSSSAYGPEEAYRALGQHTWLALPLVLMTAATVLVISAGYMRIIRHFPFGGGGYVVATRLLGPRFGLVSSCALLVDYVLTIAISVASGVDAVFSFLPVSFGIYKLAAISVALLLLTWMNLRGVKESVAALTPIFLTFVFTHLILIAGGVWMHLGDVPRLADEMSAQASQSVGMLGWVGVAALLVRAYSMGAGTYTGIEAVSNGLAIMREPKIKTGQRTMLYMATSLAIAAGGILLLYLFFHVSPQPGKTLNAVLLDAFAGSWQVGGIHVGRAFVYVALISEAVLLFVAAQAGFIGGPRVMANMANDSWLPHRFGALSENLTMHYGIGLMSVSAFAVLWFTKGAVSALVVMYSINVFLTFSLSELAMLRFSWRGRKSMPEATKDLLIFGVGSVVCVLILAITVFEKFGQGGWITLLVTGAAIAICFAIHAHYRRVGTQLKRLDEILLNLPTITWHRSDMALSPHLPTAVVLVGGYSGIGVHALLAVQKTFPSVFQNYIFVSVGVIDSASFQGVEEVHQLEKRTVESLQRYVDLATGLGVQAGYRYALGTEAVETAAELCRSIARDFPQSVFFGGKLIFPRESFVNRLLHNETAMAIQKRLHLKGLKMFVLPITADTAEPA